MSDFDPVKLSPDALERALLDSARADAATSDPDVVWQELASRLRSAASLAGSDGASGVHEVIRSGDSSASGHQTVPQGGATGAWNVDRRSIALGLGGALGGALVAAAALTWSEPDANDIAQQSPASVVVRGSPTEGRSVSAPAVQDGARAPNVSSTSEALGELAGPATAPRPAAVKPPSRPLSNRNVDESPSKKGNKPRWQQSTLSQESALVDAAREAMDVGAYRQALRIATSYHRDFPRGVLAPDAEVVAIEALARLNRPEALSRRAARFLRSYPNDAHGPRVRRLLASAR